MRHKTNRISRRGFLKTAAGASAAVAGFNILHAAHAASTDPIKLGLIGCGRRGLADGVSCLKASPNVNLIAIAELFKEPLDAARESFSKNKQISAQVAVDNDHCFVGLDAYKQLLKSDCDAVVICSPIFFHPIHLEAAIEAGKHVFMEKAACVDAPGVRQIIATGRKAREKKLNIVVGTQRRHQANYLETIKRIQDGAIGDIVAGNAWWCGGGSARVYEPQPPEMSDVEYQIRCWYRYRWTCGDHIVEQHVHNLDVIMWVLGKEPLEARGMGSQLRRPMGDCYDNFAVDFVFPGDVHVTSLCRQINDCWNLVGESVAGTKGKSNCASKIDFHDGKQWQSQAEGNRAEIQEFADLYASMRGEAPYINEAETIAKSTLLAIMGRTSAYTGKSVTWKQAMAMEEKYGPKELAFVAHPVDKPPVPPQPLPK